MKKLRVTIEGKTYEVLVEVLEEAGATLSPSSSPVPVSAPAAPTPQAVPPAQPVANTAGATADDIACPLTGKVVSIDVKVGDSVLEGAQVATVEAMKMNTYIYAPRAGRISAVLANPGDGVEEGTALLRIS